MPPHAACDAVQIVWFKRDLRTTDHAALVAAAAAGPVLALWLWEPTVIAAPTASARHHLFAAECLASLREALARLGLPLVEAYGEAVPTFDHLARDYARRGLRLGGIWSHEETGEEVTYARDRAMRAWCADRGVPWREFRQHGVIRGLATRDGWADRWERLMTAPTVPAPDSVRPAPRPERLEQGPPDIPPDAPGRQRGGHAEARRLIDGFIDGGAARYPGGISSPLSAATACSRLSPHLALGTVSMRETTAAVRGAVAAAAGTRRAAGLAAFAGRLHWHCHFIQKLETEPELEFANANRAFDGMRESDFDESRFRAWRRGETGYPLIDACMACLRETGWINFRMRAMLVSFAAYALWLHWRRPGIVLARLFTDYEPGIHWPQVQMQAGVTGINVPRMYNPVKQALEHDPHGVFVRRWIPALRRVPDAWIFEPWLTPPVSGGFRPGTDYPLPVVDFRVAMTEARRRYGAWRAGHGVRVAAASVHLRHGSRKRTGERPRETASDDRRQLRLEL